MKKKSITQVHIFLLVLFSFLSFSLIANAYETEDDNSTEPYQFTYDESSSPSTFEELGELGLEHFELQNASRAVYCQCVKYIQNRYNLSCSANAKDMGSCLTKSKFKKLSSPLAGAVIIYQPTYGSGIDGTNGHIAVITSVSYNSKVKSYTLKVRGANQGGTSTEFNCNNVGDISSTYTVGSSKYKCLSFYAK
jgi:hypothetical protein